MQKDSPADFGLWLIEVPEGMQGAISYRSARWDQSTAQLFKERFLGLSERAVANPEATLGELLSSPGEDRAGMAALTLRLTAPYLIALAKMFDYETPSQIAHKEFEANAKALLDYDDAGFFPWAFLAFSRSDEKKFANAASAAKRAIEIDGIPFAVASSCSTIIAADDTSNPLPYFLKALAKLRPEDTKEIESLTLMAEIVLRLGKEALLLTALDSAFPNGERLPFREALNAAVEKDASLLERLAPEVNDLCFRARYRL